MAKAGMNTANPHREDIIDPPPAASSMIEATMDTSDANKDHHQNSARDDLPLKST